MVEKVLGGMAYVWTKYGEAVSKAEGLEKGIPIKMICVDNNVLEDWAPALMCKKIVPLDLYEQKKVFEWI